MKTLAHLAGFSLALVVAGLGSGCVSSHTASYRQPARDFEVVETSAPRPLTDKEMSEVRASVASYLDREGATDSGDYFLKVYLTPANAGADPEWVVVRFTRYTTERVVLAGEYGEADSYYSPYYSYGIYPFGVGCVTSIAFQYYVDPFYGRHYSYYLRHNSGGGHDDRPHGRDNANNHNGDHGNHDGKPGNGNDHGSRPPPKYYGNRPGVPQNQPPRAGDTAGNDDRRDGSPRHRGDRGDGRNRPSDTANTNNRPVPPRPERSVATDQGGRPTNSAPASSRPETRTSPGRTEARREPSSRPAPVYRAPSAEPVRSYQPAPERSSPAPSSGSSSSSSDHRQAESSRQDAAR